MDWVVLGGMSPLAIGLTLLLRRAVETGRLPDSVPTPLLFGLLASLGLALLFSALVLLEHIRYTREHDRSERLRL